MADFEQVKGIRGPKLADLEQHVPDVLKLSLAPQDEYQVGELVLDSYDFAPWVLSGLSAARQAPASGTRPATHVTLPLSDDKGRSGSAERDVTLYGPGDVLGVDPDQIVRRYPAPGSTNAEETFHAHIEFDRPELPWAFGAETPADRMRPWLALVVFERDEVVWEPAQGGLQPVASVPAALLPPLDSSWAWAHAQATAGSASLEARLSTAHAPVNVSRLLAARILADSTDYVACLVPTTDAGRRAGLGLEGGALGPAWTPSDGTVRLPVYDRWEFRTAPDGDFARLARRLKGVAAPWPIGRRTIDASRPGDPLEDLGPRDAGRRQVVRCALYSPAPQPPDAPADDARWSAARVEALHEALERPAVVAGTAGVDPGDPPDLPIVGPRIYAKGQRGRATIPADGDWFAELNLTPPHRIVAGLGTRVVQKDQEELMQAAWAQVGEVEAANRALALAELARHLAAAVHRRLAKIQAGRLLQLTRPLAPRLRLDGAALTLAGQTARSATAPAALGGAFRRALRAGAPLTRGLAPAESAALAGIVSDDGVLRDFTRPYAEPDGIGGLSAAAIGALDPKALSQALGVPAGEAKARLEQASRTLEGGLSLATAVSTPSAWKQPDTSFKPGDALAGRIASQLRDRAPARPAGDAVATRWTAGLAAGLAASHVGDGKEMQALALKLGGALPEPEREGHPAPVAAPASPPLHVAIPPSAMRLPPATLRTIAGAQLRRGAAPTAPAARVALPARAAGGLVGSIARHPGAAAAAAAASDSARLELLRTPQSTVLATWLEKAGRVGVADIRTHLDGLVAATGALALPPTPARERLAARRDDLLRRLDPDRTVTDVSRARLSLGERPFDPFVEGTIRPIMAAPRFDRPMYRALDDYDREWLVPGLGTLPEPEMVTLLSANDAFTEAHLLGLSDEMGRELLWRGYPTDCRGTYFHRFWDPGKDELGGPIHRFAPHSRLGSHVGGGPPEESGRAVVVIRGEVVRRYPDMTVMALRDEGDDDAGRPKLPEAPAGPSEAAPALFHAMLPPDVMLVGLDITVDALRAPGWWIVLAEHPQATRFERKEDDVDPGDVVFAGVPGGATGATVAEQHLADPTRIAFATDDFLPPTG